MRQRGLLWELLWLLGVLLMGWAIAGVAAGCASFKGTGQRVQHSGPPEEAGGGLRVQVTVEEGERRPWCTIPGPDNVTTCSFTYGWFKGAGLLTDVDGYRHLTFDNARKACWIATNSLAPQLKAWAYPACSRRLMTYRWIDDRDYDKEVE